MPRRSWFGSVFTIISSQSLIITDYYPVQTLLPQSQLVLREKRDFFKKSGGNGVFCNRVTDIVTDGRNWLCDKKVGVGSLGIVRRRRSFDIWLKEFAVLGGSERKG